jgi:protein SCO1/2
MTNLLLDRRRVLATLAVIAAAPLAFARTPGALPGNSVYQLAATLQDQDGRSFELASLRGSPLLVSMFYSSCDMVCPMIFETVQQTLKMLPPDDRESMRVLMLSFDPARDTVPVLKKAAQAHGCDSRWTLARCDETTARKIAAVLGVQYRRLASGEFNHTSTIELLDKDGRIAARTGQLGAVEADFVKAVQVMARSPR